MLRPEQRARRARGRSHLVVELQGQSLEDPSRLVGRSAGGQRRPPDAGHECRDLVLKCHVQPRFRMVHGWCNGPAALSVRWRTQRQGRWPAPRYRLKAFLVIADKVPRVLITSGSSITSISVPSARASAAISSGSNSAVRVMRTPA